MLVEFNDFLMMIAFVLFYSVIQDPSTQRLHWISPPNNILIIRKPGPQTLPEFRQLIIKLLKVRFND